MDHYSDMENRNMAEFASNAKGNVGVALGSVGTGLGVLGSGILGGLFNPRMYGMNGCGCNEDHFVNRYEMQKDQEIARLETENALLRSNTYADQKSVELYRYVDGRFREFEQAIAQQAVYNATNTSTIACLQAQVAQLQSLTKMVIPGTNICPEAMPRYNSWTAPTAPAAAAAAA